VSVRTLLTECSDDEAITASREQINAFDRMLGGVTAAVERSS
jgi:hypothetical protein